MSKAIDWKWGAEEKKKGDEGFNNAGILTFNSHAVNSLIRELLQNSNDAKSDGEKKIVVTIDYTEIRKQDIPAFDQYQEILQLIQKSHPDRSKFFSKAEEILKHDKIPFLVYSDFKTKGLSGTDDDTNSSFVACVLSEGKSVKESKTSGGSYGIGKNAIYGVSSLRTVFYSSIDEKLNFIFQGVSKLASYRREGKNHEGRVYLGEGIERLSVRNIDLVPNAFRRQGPGLSQFVMGVELDETWVKEFSKAILRNYWMLLVQDGLEVKLLSNGQLLAEINKENTPQLLKDIFLEESDETTLMPYGNPYLFYQAFHDGERKELSISFLGKCAFFFKESDDGENNIAYMRNGMVVHSSIEKRLVGANVTGVFKCENSSGDEILRKMEPPKHDSFEPHMLEENHETMTKKDGDLILREIKTSIRDIIKSLIEKFKQETETPPFLAELFEDLQKGILGSGHGERRNERGQRESIYRIPAEDVISVSLASDLDNQYVTSTSGPELPGTGSLKGKNPARKRSKSKGGKGSKAGSSPGTKTPKLPITSRVFHDSEQNGRNVYRAVILSSQKLGTVELGIAQHGDSGSDIAFQIEKVTDLNGQPFNFIERKDRDGLVIEYKLLLNVEEGKNQYLLEVSDSQKSAFIING